MKRSELTAAVEVCKAEAREALQAVYDALNHGQRQKLMNNAGVQAHFERFGVRTGE